MGGNDDLFAIDEEFTKSLEKLVEEETNVAKAYVKNSKASVSDESKEISQKTVSMDLGMTQMFDSAGVRRSVEKSAAEDAAGEEYENDLLLDAPVSRRKTSFDFDEQDSEPNTDFVRMKADSSKTDVRGAAVKDNAVRGTARRSDTDVHKKRQDAKRNKLIIAGVVVIVVLAVLGIVIASAMMNNNKKKSYAYNHDEGMNFYKGQEYARAKEHLRMAYNTSEGKKDLDLMYALYECYHHTNDSVMAQKMLQDMLAYDKYNESALKALAQMYRDTRDGNSMNVLLDKYRGTNGEKFLDAFAVAVPTTSERAGTFSGKVKLKLLAGPNCDIYYTTDGSVPTETATLFQEEIVIEQTVRLKAIAVDHIGVRSAVAEYEFKIDYAQPQEPVFDVVGGEIDTDTTIHITNTKDQDKVYYTIDGTTPTKESVLYEDGIQLPEGTYIVAAIIYNENGGASKVARHTYTVKKAKEYTYEECVDFLKKRMIDLNILSSTGQTTTDGKNVSFYFQARKEIDGIDMNVIRYVVNNSSGQETQGYYGVGIKNGQCYKVTINSNEYTAVKY